VEDVSYASDSTGLPGLGWDCARCRAFNSDLKERRTTCRCCDDARPQNPLVEFVDTMTEEEALLMMELAERDARDPSLRKAGANR
jgi:hypothetical protein